MGLMGRLVLAASLFVTLSLGTAASAATIEAFSGHWVGKGITENADIASGVRFTDRDLDVTIKPSEDGFTIVWKTTRTTRRNGVDEVGLWSVAIAFVATGNDGRPLSVRPADHHHRHRITGDIGGHADLRHRRTLGERLGACR